MDDQPEKVDQRQWEWSGNLRHDCLTYPGKLLWRLTIAAGYRSADSMMTYSPCSI